MERRKLGGMAVAVALALSPGGAAADPAALHLPGDASPALVESAAAAKDSPEDYVAWVTLARLAQLEGDPELSLEAWAVAERLSGGNLETAAGRVEPLLATGHGLAARRAAADAVDQAPDSASAHLLEAEAWFQAPAIVPQALAAARWERALATAAELSPGDPVVLCDLGWARVTLGDQLGARQAFLAAYDAGGSCGSRGLAETEPSWAGQAGVYTTARAYPGDANLGAGIGLVGTASATWYELVTVEALARRATLTTSDDLGFPALGLDQKELWGRARLAHRGSGVELLVGSGAVSGDVTEAARALAGRAWVTRGVTLWGEGARTTYADGVATQASLGLTLPLPGRLSLDAGLELTRMTSAPGSSADDEGAARSALLALRWQRERLGVVVGARLGEEIRPLRLVEPAFYALNGAVGSSAFARVQVEVKEGTSLYLGYDLSAREDSGLTSPWGHAFTIGLSKTF